MMLRELVQTARTLVARREREQPLADLTRQLGERERPRPFAESLTRPGMSVIAEFKRMSPARGPINPDADLGTFVASYESGGAAALSILTQEPDFGGSLDDVRVARGLSELPILCKDFVVDERQLVEAALAGADAVLIMVAVVNELDGMDLSRLLAAADELDLDCVVEVRTEAELEQALEADADVIGINNRSFDEPRYREVVDLQTTLDLMPEVPAGKAVVSESGISSRQQVEQLEGKGVDAVLIGTALMTASDPEHLLRELAGDEENTREHTLP
jgi:indole-3-glycerol phosphate synthase